MPELYHQQLIDDATYIASIAINHERTERKLREREKQLNLIYENVTDVLFVLAVDSNNAYRFTSINHRFTEATGLSEDRVVGKLVDEVIPEPSLSIVLKKYSEAIQSKQSVYWEETTNYPNGVKTGQVSVTPVFDGEDCIFLVGAVHDITSSKEADLLIRQREMELRQLADAMPQIVWIANVDGHCVYMNRQWTNFTGLSIEQSYVDGWLHVIHPEDQSRFRELWQNAVDGKTIFEVEHRLRRADGEYFWWLIRGVPMLDESGEIYKWFGTNTDIHEIKLTEQKLRVAAIAFETQEGMMVTDAKINILSVNRAFTEITGYSSEEVIGKSPKLLQSGQMKAEFYRSMWKSIQDTDHWSGEIWNRRKNGEIYPEYLTITAVKDTDGKLTNYVSSLMDISLRKKSEEKIEQLAYYDQLTELPNRRLFRDRLEQDIRRVERNRSSLALLFIDLDRFKEVNDTLGHDKGDVLLIEVARRIRQHVRETDTLARLGGDEFTIILPEYGEESSIDRVVQDVLRELETPFDLGGGSVSHISCSIGIVFYPQHTNNIEDLLKHADQAMYAAKDAGRNRFCYFTTQLQQSAQERLKLANDLRHALSRKEMEVHYQPIVELSSGRTVKAEALLRWHHPQRGLVSPAQFIPLAEEYGIIHDLGNWVFMQSISAIADWRDRFKCEIQVSVNRSPMEFDNKAFMWVEALAAAELPGNAVTMEITEGLLIKKSGLVQEQLLKCRNYGIEVSIDDFGTGYSALSYLKQFDIDYLKIDQSFVRNLTDEESDKALVEAIIVMAHKLGIKTIAEGVETKAQRDLLHAFGCDYAQGYFYSKPVPAIEFQKMIAR